MIRLALIVVAALLAFAPAAQAECEDIRWEVRWQPDRSARAAAA